MVIITVTVAPWAVWMAMTSSLHSKQLSNEDDSLEIAAQSTIIVLFIVVFDSCCPTNEHTSSLTFTIAILLVEITSMSWIRLLDA